ncbi:MAG: hypothetical protein ACMXYA_03285, partial [Candidatus Woesearchaeota archaeon]
RETYYIAHNVKKIQEQQLDGGEEIQVHETDFETFLALLRREDFYIHPKVIILFYEALLEQEKLTKIKEQFGLN